MRRFVLFAALLTGCSSSPFPPVKQDYTIAFIIDRSVSFKNHFASTAFDHLARAKGALGRDLSGRNFTIMVSEINGGNATPILFEGSIRTFHEQFPDKDAFIKFLNRTPPGSSPVYKACAETIERIVEQHERHPGMHSMILVYSDMRDNQGGKERFHAALRKIGGFDTAFAVYGAPEKWKEYLQADGIRFAEAYPRADSDTPLPEIR